MAWNKDTYYYQNQMKVLSGSDPEPGYKENDVANPSDIEERVSANGFYRLIYLIRNKIKELWEAIFGAWRLEKEENEIKSNEDLNDKYKIGNYYFNKGDSTIQHRPEGSESVSFTLKVSRVNQSGTRRWQDFIQQQSGHRWYRYGYLDSTSGTWIWGKWMMVLSAKADPPIGTAVNKGTADDIFLKKAYDHTTGPIGFGKDPTDSVGEIQSGDYRVVLGKDYLYGEDTPESHFPSGYVATEGQIYFQLYNDED